MERVLIIEDSNMVMKVLRHVLSQSDQLDPVYATSFAETKQCIAAEPNGFFAALVDLSLPDAPNGEVIDYILSLNIPTIVLTGSFDVEKRQELLSKGVVDYVTKEGRYSYEFAVSILHRLIKNQGIKVLVVDDSPLPRSIVVGLLNLHLYDVYEAEDGVRAIKTLLETPDIRLLITDYNMPRMDGFELVKNIRVKYEKTDLIIIGLSTESDAPLSAKFIKAGANDFLKKPFNHEEFHCRISHNIEFLEMIEAIKDAANRDDLTETYTRKYFYDVGEQRHNIAVSNSTTIAAAVIDLDNFSEINNAYGHEVADTVLQYVGRQFAKAFGRFIVARAGSKEFYALMPGLPNDKAREFVDEIRQLIGNEQIIVNDVSVSVTFSAGVSNNSGESLDEQMTFAAKRLKRAKEAGGDLVFGD